MIEKKCTECGKKFRLYPSMSGRKRCSKTCANAYISKLYKNDENRKIQLREASKLIDHSNPERRKKQSETIKNHYRTGRMKRRSGASSNLWRGGIASLQNSLRHTAEYKAWRKAVYERDNFECRRCGTNKDLHAHHIKEFSKYEALRYVVDNGITLCRKHHGEVHGRNLPDISKANKLLV